MAWHPFRNFWLKLAAVVLGTLLWFTVSGSQVERRVPAVQVQYRNLPASLEITDQVESVDVHVRGVESQITALQPGELVVVVDLRGEKEGSRRLSLRTDQVKAPLGVEVTQVDPGVVPVTLERSGTLEVPVQPLTEGDPAPGFVVTEVSSDPPRVTAVGPERRLLPSTRAVTDRVSVTGANKAVSALVPVGIEDALLRLKQQTTARVTVRIEPAGTRSVTARVVVRNLSSGLQARVDPESVSLMLRGASRILAALETSAVVPYVNLTGLEPGVHDLNVNVDPDARFALVEVRPSTVTVRIR
jgi:YbbR domain-containing protein